MTNSVCVIFASFQPEVQSFGALAQSTNSPPVQILPSDFKSLRLRARHAFGTFGEYRTRQKDYDRASASKSDYWVRNPKCSLAFHRARACKRVVWVIAERIFPGCLARCTVSYAFAQADTCPTVKQISEDLWHKDKEPTHHRPNHLPLPSGSRTSCQICPQAV